MDGVIVGKVYIVGMAYIVVNANSDNCAVDKGGFKNYTYKTYFPGYIKVLTPQV